MTAFSIRAPTTTTPPPPPPPPPELCPQPCPQPCPRAARPPVAGAPATPHSGHNTAARQHSNSLCSVLACRARRWPLAAARTRGFRRRCFCSVLGQHGQASQGDERQRPQPRRPHARGHRGCRREAKGRPGLYPAALAARGECLCRLCSSRVVASLSTVAARGSRAGMERRAHGACRASLFSDAPCATRIAPASQPCHAAAAAAAAARSPSLARPPGTVTSTTSLGAATSR